MSLFPNSRIRQISLAGMLTALAFALSYLEHLIPLEQLLFFPGIKLGLANLVTMFALHYLDRKTAFAILTARCILQTFLFGTVSSFLFSIAGGCLALIGMSVSYQFYPKRLSLLGVGMVGAACHNTGQILCAALYFRSVAVFSYLPVLLLLSIPMGCITGGISTLLFQKLGNTVFTKHSSGFLP